MVVLIRPGRLTRPDSVIMDSLISATLSDVSRMLYTVRSVQTREYLVEELLMKNRRGLKLLLIITVLALAGLGCIFTSSVGRMDSSSEVIELEGIQKADVELRMGAGELTVSSGTRELLEGDFRYSSRDYRPRIDYSVVSGNRGELVIEQEEVRSFNLNSDYRLEWDLSLTDSIPLDIYVSLGAGKSTLDFSGLKLESLEIDMGAGDLEVYLPGKLSADLPVSIQGGIGELTIYLPEDTAVEADMTGGLGELNVYDLERQGGRYIAGNPDRDPSIQLNVEAGIGEMTVEVID